MQDVEPTQQSTQSQDTQVWDAIVIGGGAAGMMCAMVAAERGAAVLLLEHNATLGEKIRISGGGRCNFTNLYVSAENYISENPHFCKSALARFTPYDFLDMVNAHGIAYHERRWGQLFCDGSAREIIEMLLSRCKAAGASIQTDCKVHKLYRNGREHFVLETDRGQVECRQLVIATGGLSIPKIGATGFGYRIARQFGLPIVPCRAALVPLVIDGDESEWFRSLRGIAFDATLSCNGHAFQENMLFTHRGLSGPSTLQVSSYWDEGQVISINLLPDHTLSEDWFVQHARSLVSNALSQWLPKRFAQQWCERFQWLKPVGQLSESERTRLCELIHQWEVTPARTEGYGKAEVTVGGVGTQALSSKTMAARDIPGLFFIGEVVDVTGWLGGFNFQWAWASGFAAGSAIEVS